MPPDQVLRPTRTRGEHIAWAKARALRYLDAGNWAEAFTSMLSDLKKHPETKDHPGGTLGAMLMVNGHLRDIASVRNWIEGFN